MEQQYITSLLEAYKQGYEKRYAGVADAPEMKLHYFKVKEDLPRVQVVLSFLQGIVPAGQCETLLDVGSGRGVFLFPLLREFPDLDVTSLDILPHRVALHECIREGGMENLHPMLENICTWNVHIPEHIHLFSNEDLKQLFLENGCSKVKFTGVTGHTIMIATI